MTSPPPGRAPPPGRRSSPSASAGKASAPAQGPADDAAAVSPMGEPAEERTSADSRVMSNSWTSLDPYVQVLRALLPRISHLSVFDANGELHWSSEMAVDPELIDLIPAALRAAQADPNSPGEQRTAGHEQAYLFWLRRDDGVPNATPFAVMAIGCRPGGAEGDRRSFSFVHALVKPAIECLRRELMAREEILTLHTSLLEQDSDLEMLLSVSGAEANPETASDLRAIVASATEHLRAGLSALIVPENGIALVQPADREPLETTLVARAHRHLLSLAKARRQAVIVNHLVLQPGSDSPPCRLLIAPVLGADGHAAGVLALFRAYSAPSSRRITHA